MQTQLQPYRRPIKKYVTIGLITLGIVLIAGFGCWWFLIRQTDNSDSAQSTEEAQNQAVRLMAVGDNIPHETIDAQAKNAGGYNFTQFFSLVEPLLAQSDVRFCNKEAPSAGEEFGISGYPTFNAPTQFATDLNA